MKQFARRQSALFLLVLLIASWPACLAQNAAPKKKAPPKPPPTPQELFEYVRSALILLSPDDGINDNVEVTYNPANQCARSYAALRPLRRVPQCARRKERSLGPVRSQRLAADARQTRSAHTGLRRRHARSHLLRQKQKRSRHQRAAEPRPPAVLICPRPSSGRSSRKNSRRPSSN